MSVKRRIRRNMQKRLGLTNAQRRRLKTFGLTPEALERIKETAEKVRVAVPAPEPATE